MLDISPNAREIPIDDILYQEKNDMPLYIDRLNYVSFLNIIIFLILFEFGFIIISLTSSDLIVIDKKEFFFDRLQEKQDIRMAIQNLTPLNFFLTIIFQLIQSTKTRSSIPFDMNLSVRYIRNNTIISNFNLVKTFLCKFNNDKYSYKTHLIHEKISNFDSMVLANQFLANFHSFNGIRFEWIYLNPESWSLLTQTLDIFIMISLYSIFCYIFLYKQKITVNFFLLFMALLSTNPLRLLQTDQDQDKSLHSLSQTFFAFSIFVAFERLFLLSLFYQKWNLYALFLAIVFFAIYSYCESISKISKFTFETNLIKQSYNRIVTILFHISYYFFSTTIFLIKIKSSFPQKQKRFTFYFILNSFSLIVTMTTQVAFVILKINEKSIIPLYSYITTHYLIAYVIAFVHHPITKQEMIESNFPINAVQIR
ncbi:hypothetical protein M9Y10_038347 [Tritrichomonas musculus]|uniref:Transmembrane protein n=1 Tax=Tritrichomonas musculus TaxID=1915356 RepID=A0ABR2K866_9EUKA